MNPRYIMEALTKIAEALNIDFRYIVRLRRKENDYCAGKRS